MRCWHGDNERKYVINKSIERLRKREWKTICTLSFKTVYMYLALTLFRLWPFESGDCRRMYKICIARFKRCSYRFDYGFKMSLACMYTLYFLTLYMRALHGKWATDLSYRTQKNSNWLNDFTTISCAVVNIKRPRLHFMSFFRALFYLLNPCAILLA